MSAVKLSYQFSIPHFGLHLSGTLVMSDCYHRLCLILVAPFLIIMSDKCWKIDLIYDILRKCMYVNIISISIHITFQTNIIYIVTKVNRPPSKRRHAPIQTNASTSIPVNSYTS